MNSSPDLVVEIFYIQQKAHWRLNKVEILEKIHENHPSINSTTIDNAALKARELYELAEVSFHDAPSPSAAADLAVKFIKSRMPGLSERAYSAAAHIAMRNWIM